MCRSRKANAASGRPFPRPGRQALAQFAVTAYLGVPPAQPLAGFPTLAGAVAQLGERLNGIQEVRGSIPLGSTNKIKSLARMQQGAWNGCLPIVCQDVAA